MEDATDDMNNVFQDSLGTDLLSDYLCDVFPIVSALRNRSTAGRSVATMVQELVPRLADAEDGIPHSVNLLSGDM